jgi:hypothetical protein
MAINQILNLSGTSTTWTIGSGLINFQGTGLPYHSYGNPAATNVPISKNYNTTWTLNAGTNTPATTHTATPSGPIGVALNGVAIYNPSAQTTIPATFQDYTANGYHYNAAYAEESIAGFTFGEDNAGGAADTNGAYHYRDFSFANAWESGSGAITNAAGTKEISAISYLNNSLTLSGPDGHSYIIGFALDGYPIYGPYGYATANNALSGVTLMKSGYTKKTQSTRSANNGPVDFGKYPMGIFVEDYTFTGGGTLDVYNGRYCVTPEYPSGTYAYFVSVDQSTGVSAYPYLVGPSFYGTPTVFGATSATAGSGFAPTITITTPTEPTIYQILGSNNAVTVYWNIPSSNGNGAILNYEYSIDNGTTWNSMLPAQTTSPYTISGLTNGTVYQVKLRAVNAAGSGLASAVALGSPSTAATAPTISSLVGANSQITVNFTPPSSNGGFSITNYQYSLDNGTTWVSASPAQTTSPLVISGLTNGLTYNVRLRAVTSVGAGTSSTSSSILISVAATAPTITVGNPNSQYIEMYWTPPISNGGSAITNYQYSIDNGVNWISFSPAQTNSPRDITGLVNGTQYQLKLRAVNSAGPGDASAAFPATPYTIPNSPIITSTTASDGQLVIAFAPPAVNGGSSINDYLISVDNGFTFKSAGQNTSPIILKGLLNNTQYLISLQAVNAAGPGIPSSVVAATPTAGLAAAVSNYSPERLIDAKTLNLVPDILYSFDKKAIIKQIFICNYSQSAATYSLWLVPNGFSIQDSNKIFGDVLINPNTSVYVDINLQANIYDSMYGASSLNRAINIIASGVEYS